MVRTTRNIEAIWQGETAVDRDKKNYSIHIREDADMASSDQVHGIVQMNTWDGDTIDKN